MLRDWSKLRVGALLLGFVFLAAQFHFCADLTSATGTSHVCPFCATTGAAIAPSAPLIGLAPANAAVEWTPPQQLVSTDAWFTIAPRAPPSF
jgi:hypothetical protein